LPKKNRKKELTDKFLKSWYSSPLSDEFPTPEREFKFHPVRLWRFDIAWPELKVAVELHGGLWVGGGHNRGVQMQSDYSKINSAQLLGWTVLQFGTDQITKRGMRKKNKKGSKVVHGGLTQCLHEMSEALEKSIRQRSRITKYKERISYYREKLSG
jgi:hypothetical protein